MQFTRRIVAFMLVAIVAGVVLSGYIYSSTRADQRQPQNIVIDFELMADQKGVTVPRGQTIVVTVTLVSGHHMGKFVLYAGDSHTSFNSVLQRPQNVPDWTNPCVGARLERRNM